MKINHSRPLRFVFACTLFGFSFLLTACGGGDDGGGSNNTPVETYTIGGTVSGLAGTGLVIQNNNGDDLAITGNGEFSFSTPLNDSSAYTVTVLTEPTTPNQTCLVTNDSGSLAGANITDVAITCVTNTYTIGVTVSGLSGSGLILQNNGVDDLPIDADGSFTFSTALNDLSAFDVTVLTDPASPNQRCNVNNANGNLGGEDITTVSVACVNTYTLSGTVTGLNGTGLVLQNNGGDDLSIDADGGFIFSTEVSDLNAYEVSVLTSPSSPNQRCVITNASGNIAGADISNVNVVCTNVYTIGGTVSGLVGDGLVLQNNAGDDLAIAANGNFTFTTMQDDLSAYDVTILSVSDAPNQNCSVTNGSGDLAGADITNIEITCLTILHVSARNFNATDDGTGTQAAPFRTITAAIAYANTLTISTSEVRVAAGDYIVNSLQGTQVIMAEGVSLYGGYNSDWSARDPDNNQTVITDRASIATGINITNTVYIDSSITRATVLDGFIIVAGNTFTSYAVSVTGGSPTISNNTLHGGMGRINDRTFAVGLRIVNGGSALVVNNGITGGFGNNSMAILIAQASPEIRNNFISGGNSAEGSGESTGIEIRSASPTIAGNVIRGGYSGVRSYAIENQSASAVIINNTIDGGTAGATIGIYINRSSGPIIRNNTIDGGDGTVVSIGIDNVDSTSWPSAAIDNNLIYTSAGTTRICIRELGANADPASLRNNSLYACNTALYQDDDTGGAFGGNLTTITAVESVLRAEGVTASGNLQTYAFTGVTPSRYVVLTSGNSCSITQGGLDGAALNWPFADDYRGTTRTNDGAGSGWSIGASEYDGTCVP